MHSGFENLWLACLSECLCEGWVLCTEGVVEYVAVQELSNAVHSVLPVFVVVGEHCYSISGLVSSDPSVPH